MILAHLLLISKVLSHLPFISMILAHLLLISMILAHLPFPVFQVVYDPERIAESFELMGSTFLMDLHDVSSALFFWRKSVQIRHEGAFQQYPKKELGKHPVLDAQEFDSHEELELINDNPHALKMQVG